MVVVGHQPDCSEIALALGAGRRFMPAGRAEIELRDRDLRARPAQVVRRGRGRAGIDFDVEPGEVFGLLGPNGAGNTTTVEILEGTGGVTRAR